MLLDERVAYSDCSPSFVGAEMVQPGAFFGEVRGQRELHDDAGLYGQKATHSAQYSAAVRRAFDISLALIIIVAVAPLLVVLVALLQIDSPGPILFIQRRVGKNGKPFACLKLRSMVIDADQRLEQLLAESPEARAEWDADHKLRHDPRVTKLGRLTRLLSLDEFPQLLNVLHGDMSIVGPRPIVENEIWRYGEYFEDYCSVRPGITGLWQVSGRNDLTYDQRVMFDRDYARDNSLMIDMKILARTIPVVVGARGAY